MTIEQGEAVPFQEFKAQRLAPEPQAQDGASQTAKEEPVAVEEKPEAQPEEPPQEPQDEAQDKPKKGKLAERFSELTEKAKAAIRRAEEAEAKAKELEAKARELEEKSKPAPTKADDVGQEPKPADYTDAFEYAKDLAKWSTQKALRERDEQEAKAKEEAKRTEVLNTWQERINKAKAEIPDWEDTIASATELKVGDIVRDVIIESEFGPQILYHLASTDAEVAKINAMPAKDALRYIGRLEARYEAALESPEKVAPAKVEAKPRVKPPPPITPIKSGASPVNDVYEPGEFKGSYQEYKAKRLSGKV